MTPEVHALLMSAVHQTPNEAFLNFLIPAVVGLGKGLLDRAAAKSQQKKDAAAAERLRNTPQITRTRQAFDAKRFLADAAAAGFNPVTWLMAGGAASATRTKSETTGHNAAAAAQLETRTQVPSIGQAIMGGVEAGASAWLSDRQVQSQNAFQERMQKMYLQGAQQPGAARGSRFLDVPNRAHFGTLSTADNYGSGTPINTALGYDPAIGMHTPYTKAVPEVTNPYGKGWAADPSVANASDIAQRVGESEFIELGAAAYVGINDFWHNVTGTTQAERRQAVSDWWSGPMGPKAIAGAVWGALPSFSVNSETVKRGVGTWQGMESRLFNNPAKIN